MQYTITPSHQRNIIQITSELDVSMHENHALQLHLIDQPFSDIGQKCVP